MTNEMSSQLIELEAEDLDLVSAGAVSHGALVVLNLPIQINVGTQVATQVNTAVFSIAQQGGSQWLSLTGINVSS